jgi:2-polyprenyl-6-methoxyphenol hydroxylase-like FAD-dependent oxidoreductase
VAATQSHDDLKVLVVGAGIGGLTTAVALRRVGIEASVHEQAPELREVGAGISLWPNAIKALRRLGIADAVESAGCAVTHAETRDRHGAILHSSPVDQLEARFGASLVMVHRAALHAALVAALDEDAIHLDRRCVALVQEAGRVRVAFADGSETTAQVVIGADGLRSAVRAMTLGDGPPRPSGLCSWRAVTTVSGTLAEGFAGGEWWARGAVFGAQRLPDDKVYWYAADRAQPGARTSRGGEKTRLLEVFGDWQAPVPRLLNETADDDILRTDLFDRPAPDTLASGRVALLGDAAHPMLPYLGQGACQAIEDGVALAGALVKTLDDPERGLTAYSRRRLPPTTEAAVQSARMARVAHLRNPVGIALRKVLLKRTSEEATLARLAPIVGGGPGITAGGVDEVRR